MREHVLPGDEGGRALEDLDFHLESMVVPTQREQLLTLARRQTSLRPASTSSWLSDRHRSDSLSFRSFPT